MVFNPKVKKGNLSTSFSLSSYLVLGKFEGSLSTSFSLSSYLVLGKFEGSLSTSFSLSSKLVSNLNHKNKSISTKLVS